jgi:hypothetical protein
LRISLSHPGCVISPVPSSESPFLRAQSSIDPGTRSLLVARE